jgi:hypothetical protein
MIPNTCIAQLCSRKAVALVTDMEQGNLEGYAPVCISHVMTAVSNGLARGRRERPGYRRPTLVIPLDEDYLTAPTVGALY